MSTFTNGCNDTAATLIQWGCSQPPPASLPSNTPASSVLYAFDGNSLFSNSAVTTVGGALDLIDDTLACLGDPCSIQEGHVLIGADGGGSMVSSELCGELISCLNDSSNNGEFFLNSNGLVSATNFQDAVNDAIASNGNDCDAVYACLSAVTNNGELLTNSGGNIDGVTPSQVFNIGLSTSTSFCPAVFDCLDNGSADGQFFLNQGGDVVATNFASAVNSVVTANTDCAAVLQCLDNVTGAGEFLYDDGTGIAPTNFAALVAAVGGGGGGVTTWTGLTDTAATVGSAGQIVQNVGGTLTPVDFDSALEGQYGTPAAGQVLGGSGWVTPTAGPDTFIDNTDTPATYAGQAGSLLAVNQAENSLEFIELFSSFIGLSLPGAQTFASNDTDPVNVSNVFTQQGGLTNTGGTVNVADAGTYLIVWQGDYTGIASGPDVIESNFFVSLNSGVDLIRVHRARNSITLAAQRYEFGSSGAIVRPLPAGSTLEMQVNGFSDNNTVITWTLNNASLAVYRLN